MTTNEITALTESWNNGNRKDVIEAICALPPHTAAMVAVRVYQALQGDAYSEGVFCRMLEAKGY